MRTDVSTTAWGGNPIKKWGLSTNILDLDTIMICKTSHTGLSNDMVVEVLRRRDPAKYGAIAIKDIKEIFDFYFIRWKNKDMPKGLWAEKYTALKVWGTVNEALTRNLEEVLTRAKLELGMGEGEQDKVGQKTQQVVGGRVEDVDGREEGGCVGQRGEVPDEGEDECPGQKGEESDEREGGFAGQIEEESDAWEGEYAGQSEEESDEGDGD